MRITGGRAKGKYIFSPKSGGTRPMTDEMREAVFNILGPIEGLKVLDVYAGSGGIGFEALSRGAASVAAIENARQAAQIIRKNIQLLGFKDSYRLHQAPVEIWLKRQRSVKGEYDLIFTDPPFDHLNTDVIRNLAPLLQPKGLLMVRTQFKHPTIDVPGLEVVKARNYGDSAVTFYKFK